ncbi:MAG: hypothetical protein V7637_244 [Mycobacteriales bacterium]|jgi:DNA-binding SARP family transcriptional activator/Tfp pilus assembly protein PilF
MATDAPDHVLFRILGPVRLEVAGSAVDLGPVKQRCLLAALLLRLGDPVPIETLVDQVWGDRPPRGSRNGLATYATRLRHALARGGDGSAAAVLRYSAGGYLLDCPPGRVDVYRSRGLVREARECADDLLAADLLRRALQDWGAVALAGIPGGWADRARDRLHQERLDVLAERFDADLRLGRHAAVVDELRELVSRYPAAEELVARLMLALAGAGRSVEALDCYARLRAVLAEDVGSEPSAPLRELHLRVLRDDPTLAAPAPAGAPARRAAARTLPREATAFVGREDVIGRVLAAAAGDGAASVVITLDGMPGVGKTALAVHAAYRLADRYPDAQLFVDLRGVAADAPPTTAESALGLLLLALGVPGSDLPDDLDGRTALWRTKIAGRRAVLVLDNAAGSHQIGPLLPGGPGCVTLVTSRRRLTDLDADVTWSLDPLPEPAAVALFARIVGVDRADAEPAATAAVVRACGYLPLAIRVAASRLRHRPAWSVGSLAGRLRTQRQRLAELSGGDADVSTAFALSYRHLTAPQRRAFRLLGLHPVGELDRRQAAALLDLPATRAERLLQLLVDHNLLEEPVTGRYRFHDLLHQYARDMAAGAESDGERLAAAHRLVDVLTHTAQVAARLVDPRPRQFDLDVPTPVPDEPPPATGEDALAWLEIERANLVAAVRLAVDAGADDRAWLLAQRLQYFLALRGYFDDLLLTHQLGLAAASRGGHRHGQAAMHNGLGNTYLRSGRYAAAATELTAALALHREAGDRLGVARGLNNLALIYEYLGRYAESTDSYVQALAEFRALGDLIGQSGTLNNLGVLHRTRGRYSDAIDALGRGLELAREAGEDRTEGNILGNLGATYAEVGRRAEALSTLRQAVRMRAAAGDPLGTASSRNDLAVVYRQLGRLEEALEQHNLALATFQAHGDRTEECRTRVDLGETLRVAGRPEAARPHLDRALALAEEDQQRYQQGRALDALARLTEPTEPAAAGELRRRAQAIFAELGAADAAAGAVGADPEATEAGRYDPGGDDPLG